MTAGPGLSLETRHPGAALVVRPAAPDDKEYIQALVRGLSRRSRYLRFLDPYPRSGEFAVVVDDAWQGMGIGTRLIDNLIHIVRDAGVERIEGEVLVENQPMLRLVRSRGFEVRSDPASVLYLRVSRTLAQTTIH